MRRLYISLALLLAVGLVVTVNANLVFIGPLTLGGAGLGAVNTVLSIQGNPNASGCVAWNGTADVVGPAACPPGIPGGAEKTGASQTQTRSIAELGIANAASIRVVFNANEPNAGPVTLNQLVLRIYAAGTGAVLFSGALPAPVPFPTTSSGTGSSGFGFALDGPQAIAAQAGFANPANRLGLSALNTESAGGPGTFYLTNVTTPLPPCAITISPVTVGDGVVGTAYSRTLTASGGTAPYTFAVTGGALPSGVTLSSTGVLAGTPTAGGIFTFTVRGTDANGCFGNLTFVLPIATAVPTLPPMFMVLLAAGVLATAYYRLSRRARAK